MEQIDAVDVISIDEKTGAVVLTVSDHVDWSETLKHQALLQAKLNTYIHFVESGELLKRFPRAKDRRVAFSLVFKFAPDEEAQAFLARVQQVVSSEGIDFRYELFSVSSNN